MAVFWIAAPPVWEKFTNVSEVFAASITTATISRSPWWWRQQAPLKCRKFYQTTRRYNPEDIHLHARRRENLKPYIVKSGHNLLTAHAAERCTVREAGTHLPGVPRVHRLRCPLAEKRAIPGSTGHMLPCPNAGTRVSEFEFGRDRGRHEVVVSAKPHCLTCSSQKRVTWRRSHCQRVVHGLFLHSGCRIALFTAACNGNTSSQWRPEAERSEREAEHSLPCHVAIKMAWCLHWGGVQLSLHQVNKVNA
jgi:hypothetical protein